MNRYLVTIEEQRGDKSALQFENKADVVKYLRTMAADIAQDCLSALDLDDEARAELQEGADSDDPESLIRFLNENGIDGARWNLFSATCGVLVWRPEV